MGKGLAGDIRGGQRDKGLTVPFEEGLLGYTTHGGIRGHQERPDVRPLGRSDSRRSWGGEKQGSRSCCLIWGVGGQVGHARNFREKLA